MEITVIKVYDKQRFTWFIHLKYKYSLEYANKVARDINHGFFQYSFSNLTEEEVRYLQATNSCGYYHEHICKLKIIPTKMPLERKQNTPTYLNNEKKSSKPIDIAPSCDNEPQSSSYELYSVTYTKVIENKEALNIHQITALLKDKHVKSINIDK